MKVKRRRVLEVPPNIKSFIDNVRGTALDKIEEHLKDFSWDFDKGDFHHWVDLFNIFDTYLEKHIKPRKDLHLEENFLEADPPFPKGGVLQILRVTRVILDNCANKHTYGSYEQHLSALLASTDADVIEASLQTLAAFLKKPVGKSTIRDSSLISKLYAFSQGWGPKEEGLGLIACSMQSVCDSIANEIGSTLYFEFYADNEKSAESCASETSSKGLQVIQLTSLNSFNENTLGILHKLVEEYKVPSTLCFSLLTRLRFARAFDSLSSRHQYVCIRLYAFIVLVQTSNGADDLNSFFNNEPEFVNELVLLLSYEDLIPEKIQILGLRSLAALCHDRSHQPTVLSAVSSGGHRGILPGLMQKAVDSITSGSGKQSVNFAEALLCLVTVLVSSSPGSSALRDAGFIPTLLPFLKDADPLHLNLVSTAVHVLEAFMDYSNPAVALFRELGGLDDTIARLKIEVSCVEMSSNAGGGCLCRHWKGKQTLHYLEGDSQHHYSETLVSYHRRLLIKALLRAISLGTYAPGSTTRICDSEENLLPQCLCIIFRKAKDFGGGIFSLAASVMSDLIHKDPTCFSVLNAAELPRAFLNAIMTGVLMSSEAIICIPQCLDALCLHSSGLQAIMDCDALKCFVKIFTSKTYLRALSGDAPMSLSSSLDELIRHSSSLRSPAVNMFIEILDTILKIGSGSDETISFECQRNLTMTPMETDPAGSNSASLDEGEGSKVQGSKQMILSSPDVSELSTEAFLPECIGNAAHLLEAVLQNADTCSSFIERKGIESVLQLFSLPLLPFHVSIGPAVADTFKNFSLQHSAILVRTVCSHMWEHIKKLNELFASVGNVKLMMYESAKQMKVLRSLSALEGLLSLSNFLLKGSTNMILEFGSSDAGLLKDLGKVYKDLIWQISLCNDSEEYCDQSKETKIKDTWVSNISGRESDNETSSIPLLRYMSPFSVRSGSASHWSAEQVFLSAVRSADGPHRHRHSRTRSERLSRQLNITPVDSESATSLKDTSLLQDTKKKNPDVLVAELLQRLGLTMRSFYNALVKGLSPRRRADHGSLSSACKTVTTALANLFLEALSYSGNSNTSLDMSLSVKCIYLGKVVDDIIFLLVDNRKRSCNISLVNSFYVNGSFKELLTTFEATSQLLWTIPPGHSQEKAGCANKLSHSSWLLCTLQSYCRLLAYFVNASLLLSSSSQSQAQLLVQPITAGLSIGLFPVPRDPQIFVQMLQSQVLDVILPIWNHPLFAACSPSFISSVVCIVTHVYSGVGDLGRDRNSITGSAGQRISVPSLDESSISSIVEMGFSRNRAEEALRNLNTNSVQMAMDWLLSHPDDNVQEDVQLAQALELSLGNSSELPIEENTDKLRASLVVERGAELPPVDDILSASMKLFQCGDAVAFSLTDLLVTLCNRNKGGDRQRVTLFLIQQLKICPSDSPIDVMSLSQISHLLALLLCEDGSTRQIAAENGIVVTSLDILAKFSSSSLLKEDGAVSKCSSALFLILDYMVQSKPKGSSDTEGDPLVSLAEPSGNAISSVKESAHNKLSALKIEKETCTVFEKILGKPTGYLTVSASQRALVIACNFIKMHAAAVVMQAIFQLCARLTKTHALAMLFLENDGLSTLFSLPMNCFFPGFDTLASVIIRHLIEDPQTLKTAMELEIRQTLTGRLGRHAARLSPKLFLISMAPLISRDSTTFMQAAIAVCQLESSGGRVNIILSRDKEKEKPKSSSNDSGVMNADGICFPETKSGDVPSKCSQSHKKLPASLTQVVSHLLEITSCYPLSVKHENHVQFFAPMDIDEPGLKEKGKSKFKEAKKMDVDINSDESALLAKVTFVLKLLSDILLMYVHAAGVVLRRDVEACQLHSLGQAEQCTHVGIVHHILHQLLPISSDKVDGASDEWKVKLSQKASWFLVVLCGRSCEGRRRVITEIVKAFSLFSSLDNYSAKCYLAPNKKILVFTDLLYSILSKSSFSTSLPGFGCSPDIVKSMIDNGVIKSLTDILQVIDLDHPDTPKIVNLIVKALEILTRAANVSEQLYKLDGPDKKKPTGATDRFYDQTNPFLGCDVEDDPAINSRHQTTDATPTEEQQARGSSNEVGNRNTNQDLSVEQDTPISRLDDNIVTDLTSGQQMGDFMPDDMDAQGALHNIDDEGMPFQIEQQITGNMGDEDDDIVADAEDDDEDNEDDGNGGEEETTLMSLADTDTEDHNENGLIDEYNDDMVDDDDDDDFPENRVIEVRWRGELDGLDRPRLLRGSGDASRFVNITAEPFPGLEAGDAFRFRRPLGFDRHRQSGRNLGRAGLEHNPFQHPLLIRPSHPGETNISLWPSVGNTSREIDSVSVGSFDLPNFYMFDYAFQSDYADTNLIGDRFVSTVPQPVSDFPLGIDPLHVGGRRGPGDGRWTDDGQRQPGGEATAIAHAVEDHFVSCLRSTISTSSYSDQRQSKETVGLQTKEQNVPVTVNGAQPHIIVDDNMSQQNEGHHYETVLVSDNERHNVVVEFQERTNLMFTGGEPANISVVEDPSTTVPVMFNNTPNSSEFILGGEEPVSTERLLETVHDVDTPLPYLQNVGDQVPDSADVSTNLHDQCTDFAAGVGICSSSHAVIDSGSTIAELSDGHVDPVHITNDIDMNGPNVTGNHAEVHSGEGMSYFQRESHIDVINNNESSSTNLIDPTFLEALPEDLRAEVLASQQGSHQIRPTPEAAYAPYPPEEIDPEFLAALPPDIQAEVLAQQRSQRYVQSRQVEGPVDMDNASILATFPPDLREEVLLTSPDTVLSSLPSNFLAEAQILRDRAANHYNARSSLFGGSHRLGNRRLAVDRQTVTDRGVGSTIGGSAVSSFANNLKVKEIKGVHLMDVNALSALVRLMRLSQPLGKGLLQRLLLNLCAHGVTRVTLIYLLLDMIKPETEESVRTSARCSDMRLFGRQWNVSNRSHSSDGLPPLLLRRILEMLTYLATNHLSVANLLFFFDYPLNWDVSATTPLKQKSLKGKEKIYDVIVSPKRIGLLQKGHTPLQLLLKLLINPLFLRSNSHLEQVMSLLQVTISNAVTNMDFHTNSETASQNSKSLSMCTSQIKNEFLHNTTDFSEGSSGKKLSNNVEHGAPYASGAKTINPCDILLELSECDLHNLCGLLAREGLSDKIYSLAAEVVKKLAFITASHRKFFSKELAGLAENLSSAAVTELITLRSTQMLGLSASSWTGAAILRVLQTLTSLTSATDVNKSQDVDSVQEEQSILQNLSSSLEPLWQELSDCMSSIESKLGENSMFSSPVSDSNVGDLAGTSSSPVPLLPPAAQRLLPHIEAFFVLCEKLQVSQSVVPADPHVTAREVKESAVCSPPPSFKCTAIGALTFSKVAEKHRHILNAFIRQSPALLEKSLSMMLKIPRLIDFDNKRAFFRSRIRQQHDKHSSVPLRITVRRAYVLEDSYNQLRLRSDQELKGRLTVQFQGEEGIDAGGLTREWYQLLSRVIFDKGALLFTTIGNHATFQPNPNSVYQTEHLSYFKFVGRVVAKALFDGQLLDVHFTRSFYKHLLGVKVTYHDIEAVDPDYYKNLKWMLENDVSDIPDLTFSMDADEEKHILYEKTEVTDYELKPGGRNIRVTEETKHEYVDLVADHILSTAIRPQINSFLEGFNELIPVNLVSIFNDKELELLISGLPEIEFDDLRANTEYAGYTAASNIIQWFWEVLQTFNKEDMARFLQFVTGTAKVPLEGFKALQGISGPQRFQIHKAYGSPERLPSAHTCFNQLDLPEYSSKKQLEERLLLAIHEACEGFGFG